MELVTPPIHLGRVILYVWNKPRLVSLLCDVYLGWYVRPYCAYANVMLIIQYALYIISLKTLHLPSGEGVLSFSAAIHFAMKCSAPCSAILRHSPSS